MNTPDHDMLTPDQVEHLRDLYADVSAFLNEAAAFQKQAATFQNEVAALQFEAAAWLKEAGALLSEAGAEPRGANSTPETTFDTPSHTNRVFLAFVAFHDGLDGDDFDHALGILNIAVAASNLAEARSRVWELLENERTMFDSFFWEHGGEEGLERPCTDNGWFYCHQPLIIEATEGLLAEAGGVDIDLRQDPLTIDKLVSNSFIDESGDEDGEDEGGEGQILH